MPPTSGPEPAPAVVPARAPAHCPFSPLTSLLRPPRPLPPGSRTCRGSRPLLPRPPSPCSLTSSWGRRRGPPPAGPPPDPKLRTSHGPSPLGCTGMRQQTTRGLQGREGKTLRGPQISGQNEGALLSYPRGRGSRRARCPPPLRGAVSQSLSARDFPTCCSGADIRAWPCGGLGSEGEQIRGGSLCPELGFQRTGSGLEHC